MVQPITSGVHDLTPTSPEASRSSTFIRSWERTATNSTSKYLSQRTLFIDTIEIHVIDRKLIYRYKVKRISRLLPYRGRDPFHRNCDMCFLRFCRPSCILVIFLLEPEDIMPATSSQRAKKDSPKSKMKESLDSNASKQTQELREKQLEDEEKLFEEQILEAGESTDICGSDLEEDKGLASDNFSTPKGRFANTCRRAKSDVKVTNSPTNPTH